MDETESIRRHMLETGQPAGDLAQQDPWFQKRWTTEELRAEFEVIGFMAPFVAVRRKADGKKGSMEFVHSPRVYFNFMEDNP